MNQLPRPDMQSPALDMQEVSICFLPAERCRAEQMAGVYSPAEQPRQLVRLQALLTDASAHSRFFVTAEHKGKTIALLHLCRDRRRPGRFRIRGVETARPFRCQGLAVRLLQVGAENIFFRLGGEVILSFILPTNSGSLAAHGRAGFQQIALPGPQPQRHLCFALERNNTGPHNTIRQNTGIRNEDCSL